MITDVEKEKHQHDLKEEFSSLSENQIKIKEINIVKKQSKLKEKMDQYKELRDQQRMDQGKEKFTEYLCMEKTMQQLEDEIEDKKTDIEKIYSKMEFAQIFIAIFNTEKEKEIYYSELPKILYLLFI